MACEKNSAGTLLKE